MKLFSFKKKKGSTLKAEETKRWKSDRSDFRAKNKDRAESQEEEPSKENGEEKKGKLSPVAFGTKSILLRPRITEKATDLSVGHNVHVFEVGSAVTKKEVIQSVEEMYKVTPEKVNMVKIPAKKVMNRRSAVKGIKSGGKKAYVFLKQGDSINVA